MEVESSGGSREGIARQAKVRGGQSSVDKVERRMQMQTCTSKIKTDQWKVKGYITICTLVGSAKKGKRRIDTYLKTSSTTVS